MIPDCIKLTKEQIDKYEKWKESLQKMDEYEDCSMASCITFEIYSTGLGDVIYAVCKDKKCSLTIDDDGELID